MGGAIGCILQHDIMTNVGLFDGQYRSKPSVSLRGASRQVTIMEPWRSRYLCSVGRAVHYLAEPSTPAEGRKRGMYNVITRLSLTIIVQRERHRTKAAIVIQSVYRAHCVRRHVVCHMTQLAS